MKLKNEIAKLSEGQMLVICTSVGNPSYGQYLPLSDPEFFIISSHEQASAACLAYIEMWDLGGGNWSGGQVYNTEGRVIAQVSYNGRVQQFHGLKQVEVTLAAESVEAFLTHYRGKYDELMNAYCAQQGMPTIAELFAD